MAETVHKKKAFDMKALIEKSRQQSAEADAVRSARQQSRRQVKVSNNIQTPLGLNEAKDIQSARSGDYIQTEDGLGAIVIDHEEELEKIRGANKTAKALDNLLDNSTLVIDANAYNPKYKDGFNPRDEWLRRNPAHSQTKNVIGMMEGFGKLTYGLNGLVKVGSPEAIAVNEALENLRSGKVVLPTPEEYEMQKQAAEERRRARREKLANKGKGVTKQQTPKTSEPSSKTTTSVKRSKVQQPQYEERKMAEMPKNVIMKKGVYEEWLK